MVITLYDLFCVDFCPLYSNGPTIFVTDCTFVDKLKLSSCSYPLFLNLGVFQSSN